MIRSTNRSVSLVINMIHSVVLFYPTNGADLHPFILFHDENFTSSMEQQIRSCLSKHKKKVQIFFALVNFRTTVLPSSGSRLGKPIGYRLMCRFWTYDVFYHPAIIQGKYEYLIRMDDDSYLSDNIKRDIIAYMNVRKLDYVYRSRYFESIQPLISVLMHSFNASRLHRRDCIYNNFFAIRLKWFYESKPVQDFLRELLRDDYMLREYVGDGCAHAVMLQLDRSVKIEHITDIAYGHNYHIMPAGVSHWSFDVVPHFYQEIEKSCEQLTVITKSPATLKRFNISEQMHYRRVLCLCSFICLLSCYLQFRFRSPILSSNAVDQFLSSTLCGRLIRIPNVQISSDEATQLREEASLYFSMTNDCNLLKQSMTRSSDELMYPLAFSIIVHGNFDQLGFLLHTIYRPYNHYCVHVDSKASASLYEAIDRYSACVPNVYVLKTRINVTWGRFSVLEAEHLCQKKLLQQSRTWKYYFNLANTDVPLKTNHEIVQILKLYRNQNDVTSLAYRSLARQKAVLIDRTLPPSIRLPLYKGEFHVLLSRSAVEFIQTSSRAADLYRFLNGTSVPDEHFYSIVNRWKEAPGFYPYDHDLSQVSFMTRYKIWNDRPESDLCSGHFVRGICVFGYRDLWHLSTSPHFFGNKIFLKEDRLVPYCMSEYLRARVRMEQGDGKFSMIDLELYKQLKNVQFGKENNV